MGSTLKYLPNCATVIPCSWGSSSTFLALYNVVILLKTMWLSLPLMLANIMREEEIIALFMSPFYLKCKLLIIMCIGYHKVAAIYSYTKCQCIGRELDFEVNAYMLCGVLHLFSNTIQFEHTFVSL